MLESSSSQQIQSESYRGIALLAPDAECQSETTKRQLKSAQRIWMDYAITYLTTLGLIIVGMLTFRVVARSFGELGLSQYAVMRRIIAFIQPPLALGLAEALSRIVAGYRAGARSKPQ